MMPCRFIDSPFVCEAGKWHRSIVSLETRDYAEAIQLAKTRVPEIDVMLQVRRVHLPEVRNDERSPKAAQIVTRCTDFKRNAGQQIIASNGKVGSDRQRKEASARLMLLVHIGLNRVMNDSKIRGQLVELPAGERVFCRHFARSTPHSVSSIWPLQAFLHRTVTDLVRKSDGVTSVQKDNLLDRFQHQSASSAGAPDRGHCALRKPAKGSARISSPSAAARRRRCRSSSKRRSIFVSLKKVMCRLSW
jgi:hypothetical protein